MSKKKSINIQAEKYEIEICPSSLHLSHGHTQSIKEMHVLLETGEHLFINLAGGVNYFMLNDEDSRNRMADVKNKTDIEFDEHSAVSLVNILYKKIIVEELLRKELSSLSI